MWTNRILYTWTLLYNCYPYVTNAKSRRSKNQEHNSILILKTYSQSYNVCISILYSNTEWILYQHINTAERVRTLNIRTNQWWRRASGGSRPEALALRHLRNLCKSGEFLGIRSHRELTHYTMGFESAFKSIQVCMRWLHLACFQQKSFSFLSLDSTLFPWPLNFGPPRCKYRAPPLEQMFALQMPFSVKHTRFWKLEHVEKLYQNMFKNWQNLRWDFFWSILTIMAGCSSWSQRWLKR